MKFLYIANYLISAKTTIYSKRVSETRALCEPLPIPRCATNDVELHTIRPVTRASQFFRNAAQRRTYKGSLDLSLCIYVPGVRCGIIFAYVGSRLFLISN